MVHFDTKRFLISSQINGLDPHHRTCHIDHSVSLQPTRNRPTASEGSEMSSNETLDANQMNDQEAYAQVTIQGIQFDLSMPYKEGHVLTPGEASQLNQVRFENIRNNFAATVRKAADEYRKANGLAEDADVPSSELDTEDLQEKLSAYEADYEMGVRSGPTGPRLSKDPVLREAERIAEEKVKVALKKKGVSINSVPKEKMAQFISGVISKYPEITEEAKRRVSVAADIALDAISI